MVSLAGTRVPGFGSWETTRWTRLRPPPTHEAGPNDAVQNPWLLSVLSAWSQAASTSSRWSGVDWQLIKPFIVIGLAFGGVYALQGVGLVVLYRATGVLNIAFGAIGAAGALIAYYLVQHTSWPHWLAYTICVLFGGVLNLAYGMVFGPAFARRDPLVKMMGTLGLALILLGLMAWRAPAGGAFARFLPLPSSAHHYEILKTSVSLTDLSRNHTCRRLGRQRILDRKARAMSSEEPLLTKTQADGERRPPEAPLRLTE